jgi:cytochrome b6-f complex iron-sulfur subunit
MKMPPQTRREFCSQACQAVGLAAMAGALHACGGGGLTGASSVPALPRVSGSVTNSAITLTIDSSSPLASVGGAALVQTADGLFLVAQTGPGSFTALASTCTHQACTITGFENQDYVCPCHGSRFDTSGRVVNGPAVTPLRSFPTHFAGNVLSISL